MLVTCIKFLIIAGLFFLLICTIVWIVNLVKINFNVLLKRKPLASSLERLDDNNLPDLNTRKICYVRNYPEDVEMLSSNFFVFEESTGNIYKVVNYVLPSQPFCNYYQQKNVKCLHCGAELTSRYCSYCGKDSYPYLRYSKDFTGIYNEEDEDYYDSYYESEDCYFDNNPPISKYELEKYYKQPYAVLNINYQSNQTDTFSYLDILDTIDLST